MRVVRGRLTGFTKVKVRANCTLVADTYNPVHAALVTNDIFVNHWTLRLLHLPRFGLLFFNKRLNAAQARVLHLFTDLRLNLRDDIWHHLSDFFLN